MSEEIVKGIERLESMLEDTNTLLYKILEAIEDSSKAKSAVGGGRGRVSQLTRDEKADLQEEINLEVWFANYGEEALPAKYMCASSGIPAPGVSHYSKDEGEFIYNELKSYTEEQNEQGTHVFKYLGKVWCKREKNARNCFAFVPVNKQVFLNENETNTEGQ